MCEINGPCIVVFAFPNGETFAGKGEDGRWRFVRTRAEAVVFEDGENEAGRVVDAHYGANAKKFAFVQAVQC